MLYKFKTLKGGRNSGDSGWRWATGGRALLALLATLALVVTGCGGSSDEAGGSASSDGDGSAGEISIVAYSTPEVVYNEIIPDFQATPEGKGVAFKRSFGASGDQSRAVEAGQKADFVSFSTEPDMTRLVDAGLVAEDWRDNPNRGLVNTSLVAFIVREGNPKNIKNWDDLLRPGIKVLTPNPFTSGAARWNILAPYLYASRGGSDHQAGLDFVRELITEHVPVQDKSGREALQTFLNGDADVLLSYEYEAITANKQGSQKVDYVIPEETLRIDIYVATTKDAPPIAKTFLDYVLSEPGQERFAGWGYRPINEAVLARHADEFPNPQKLWTIDDLGGWAEVNPRFFSEDGPIAKIEEEAGVSTTK